MAQLPAQPPPLPIIAPKPKLAMDRRTGERRQKLDLLRTLVTGTRTDSERRGKDRRATPRLRLEVECEELLPESTFFRITTDLSTFGLSTRLGPAHPKGTMMQLRLYLPDLPSEPLALQAEVVGPYDAHGGVRVRFHRPSVEAVRRIHRYLMRRAQETTLAP